MKTFQQFQEQLPSNYTDYKVPSVQAAHARSMQMASRIRRSGGPNVVGIDPKDEAQANLDAGKRGGRGVIQPLGRGVQSGVQSFIKP